MKKILATLFFATLALTGCAAGNADAETGSATRLYEEHITLKDGRTVVCIEYVSYQRGGVSCDWDGAK